MHINNVAKWVLFASVSVFLSGCASEGKQGEKAEAPDYPVNQEDARKLRHGKITGEGGLKLFGPDDESEGGGTSPIGVNSFLWRATLDTLTFMPIASADPFGGVILTDWYEDPNVRGERFKITALILDRSLRTDAVKVTVFKQVMDVNHQWRDEPVSAELGRKLENTILTRARELRVKQS